MTDRPGLSSPHINVIMADGAEWGVQTLNVDMLRWERHAIKNKLPVAPGSAPVQWLTYLSFSAGQREGMIPSTVTWQQFSESMCVSVNSAEDGPATVDPTEAEPDID